MNESYTPIDYTEMLVSIQDQLVNMAGQIDDLQVLLTFAYGIIGGCIVGAVIGYFIGQILKTR